MAQTNVSGKTGNRSFAQIPSTKNARSAFNRSHGYKTTLNSGYLVPVFADEVLPGDTVHLTPNFFARMATPLKPTMDGIHLDWFFFSVPLRQLWDNFEAFMGEREPDPDYSVEYVTPKITSPTDGFEFESLADYLGVPPGVQFAADDINAFFFRAYNRIFNEWFRDENLVDSVVENRDDGPDTATDYTLLQRGKRHDYFTSALPFAQKGDPVQISLGVSAPLVGFADVVASGASASPTFGVPGNASTAALAKAASPSTNILFGGLTSGSGDIFWQDPELRADLSVASGGAAPYADLSNAEAVTINALRLAVQTQRLLERDARGGTRYQEIILSHFGVVSDDARLQRPEYLGGGTMKVQQHPVANTAGFGGGTGVVGNLGGFATAASNGRGGFVKSFTEHQVILGLVNVRADLTYQQGLNRKFSRSTRYDYFWPAFAHLGEQAILSKEIFADGTAADQDVFGYQERWAEYRYFPNTITGKFRSQDPTSLDVWHVAEEFASRPTLNETFISVPVDSASPIKRVLSNQTEPEFLFDAFFEIKHVRPMPVYSVPGMMDHF